MHILYGLLQQRVEPVFTNNRCLPHDFARTKSEEPVDLIINSVQLIVTFVSHLVITAYISNTGGFLSEPKYRKTQK